jgi:Tol biopolymer transport system component
MRKTISWLASVAAAIAMGPMLVGIAAPAQADDGSCITGYHWTDDPASDSEPFNASIGCNGAWALWSYDFDLLVRGQYLKGGWQNSILPQQRVTPAQGHDQVIGQTVDGRRLRGHQVGGDSCALVMYKY